jgi:photosystem II stability/assembly factor-like uncharacterized protein
MSRAPSLCLAVLLIVAGCDDDVDITHLDASVDYDLAVRDMAVPPDLTKPTWRMQVPPVTTSLYAIYGAAGQVFAVGDRGTILRTDDQGMHWRALPSGTTAALFGVWTDGATAIAVGYHGTLLRSVDDGATWKAMPVGTATLRSVFGAGIGGDGGGAPQLWVVGEGGTVLQSNDAGLSWAPLATPAGGDVRGVWASLDETFVVGDNLVRTRDDGASFTQLLTGVFGLGVWASGSGQLIVAKGATIQRSRDGGLTWDAVPSGTSAAGSIIGFAAFAFGELWSAHDGGALRHVTSDFDTALPADDADLGRPLRAIWGSDPSNLFVVGDNGFIAHRE